jgi:hypothetical protein
MHYRKYSQFRKRELPQLAEGAGARVGLLEGQREEVRKAAE